MSAVAAADRAGEALAAAIDALAAAGVESPRLDAELLLSDASGIDRTRLIADPDCGIEPGAARAFGQMVRRRLRREPVAYILGRRWFRDLELLVDSRALIPRPETELLVEVGVELGVARVLDVGTGSGAVALALAAELPDAEVVATDSSPAALDLAAENAARLGLGGRVRFEPGTLPGDGTFDLLLANLPYVAEPEWGSLAPEIRDWEPRAALVGEGLHEEIARLASTRLLVFEVGDGQADHVADAMASLGYADIAITPDLAEEDRVVEGRR